MDDMSVTLEKENSQIIKISRLGHSNWRTNLQALVYTNKYNNKMKPQLSGLVIALIEPQC